MAAYVQQHGGGDFTSPGTWPALGRAFLAWCVLAAVSGRHPPMAVEDALRVAVLLLPFGSNGSVCSHRCVQTATVLDGGGSPLLCGCPPVRSCLRVVRLRLTGLATLTMVRRR